MVIISAFDVVCFVPYWSGRFKATAAVADRSSVLVDLTRVLNSARGQLHHSRRINLATLVESGSISPECLRPLGMSVQPRPSLLRALKRAIQEKNLRKVAKMIPE